MRLLAEAAMTPTVLVGACWLFVLEMLSICRVYHIWGRS
jgi:hypothetical protein